MYISCEQIIALIFVKHKNKVIPLKSIQNEIKTFKNKEIVFLFSENYIYDMINEYQNYFERIDDSIIVKESVDTIIQKFIAYIPNEIIKSYLTKE